MSETTPDPAHTGTDRVELTEAELARLSQAVETDDGTGYIYAVAYAVRSILAGRLAELTDERDKWKAEAEAQHEYALDVIHSTKSRKRTASLIAERDAARAETAAANARCAELEAKWLASDQRAERNGAAADALQATLDRVTALADEWEELRTRTPSREAGELRACTADLRAALTPEGTE